MCVCIEKLTHFVFKLAARVETLKEQIGQQQVSMDNARVDKEKALQESKRIESEMNDFNNNKDTKLDEMTVTFIFPFSTF